MLLWIIGHVLKRAKGRRAVAKAGTRLRSQMRILWTTLVVVTITGIGVDGLYLRGPIGPESIVSTEVEGFVAKSAARADASVTAATEANPNLLKLPPDLEPKRRVKRLLGKIGIVYPAPESALQFTIRQQQGPLSIRCLIVLRGDHVLGIAVIADGDEDSFADRVQDALKVEFRGYKVQRLSQAP